MHGLPPVDRPTSRLKTLSAILAFRPTFRVAGEHCVQLPGAVAVAGLVNCNAQLQVLDSIPSAGPDPLNASQRTSPVLGQR
jgi:hypothetical protein